MMSSIPSSIPFADIAIQIVFKGSGRLPPFRGATLRGALGYMLKKTVCHVKGGHCQSCPVMAGCVYSTLFEGVAPPERTMMQNYDTIPQPFVLILPAEESDTVEAEQSWEFALRLFSAAIHQLPYLAYCFMEIGNAGLGRDQIPFEVTAVKQHLSDGSEKILYHQQSNTIGQARTDRLNGDVNEYINTDRLKIHYLTPVKYRYEGKLYGKPDFAPFMMAAVRRIRIMNHFYGDDLEDQVDFHEVLAAADEIELVEDQTHLTGFNRYSNRQQASMAMSGITGTAVYQGDFELIWPVLKLAELTFVGKNTSFGFGRIQSQFIS